MRMVDDKEWFRLKAEKVALEVRLRAVERKRDEYAESVSFRLGLLINRALLRPGWHTLRLPYDVVRLLRGTLPVADEGDPVVDECPFAALQKTDFSLASTMIVKNGEQRPLTIACILDSLSAESFSYEANLLLPTPGEAWKDAFAQHTPDMFLVESFWRGNNSTWGRCDAANANFKCLLDILDYCIEYDIPTVFWNKEDPVSFELFAPIAQCFDYVFTSDADSIKKYLEEYGLSVETLQFAAAPAVHNPLPKEERIDKAVFAGTYFSKYPQRCKDFDYICSCLEEANIDYDIYDRHANTPIEFRELTMYPKKYRSKILGSLPPSDMWRVNKGYKYQINVNSVQNSPTMFARRVYEALASGSLLLSNYSLGVTRLFGDIVFVLSEDTERINHLQEVAADEKLYHDTVIRGVRTVFDNHTYAHRLQQICDTVGIQAEMVYTPVKACVEVKGEEEFKALCELVRRQKYPNAEIAALGVVGFNGDEVICGDQRRVIVVQDIDDSYTKLSFAQLTDDYCFSDIAYGLSYWK